MEDSEIIKCKHCDKEFVPKRHSRQIFCSANCRWTNWANKNRAHLNQSVRKYRAKRYLAEGQWRDDGPKAIEAKKWMIEIKSKPCVDCGNTFPVCCMDFDHRIGTVKSYNVGSMFAHHYSKELIELELLLVCANCHRIRTKNRRIGSGKQKQISNLQGI